VRIYTQSAVRTYGFHTDLGQSDFLVWMARVIAALKAEGRGVLAEIAVQATMKSKLGVPCAHQGQIQGLLQG